MKKNKNIIFILAFAVVALLCMIFMSGKKGRTASIYIDGALVQSVDLEQENERFEIKIGEHNTALVENGTICMYEADCPDQLCVNQGAVSDGAYPIVCLPNKVVIRVKDDK